jgi:hypothetical protein
MTKSNRALIRQLVFIPLLVVLLFNHSIRNRRHTNMAWLAQYLSYGKNSAPDDSELKLLRDDRSLRSSLQGEISSSGFTRFTYIDQ